MDTIAANFKSPKPRGVSISLRCYRCLLFAYPAAFRREYGRHMLQLFQDCHRSEHHQSEAIGIARLWFRTLLDLARTAPAEHLDQLRKENLFMKNLRRDALALIGCVTIIAVAFFLLSYGRRHEVVAILTFGRALDALVVAGVMGNLIVFVLVKTARFDQLKTAWWTFLTVSVLLLSIAALLENSASQLRMGSLVLGYLISFVFWLGVHWIWSQTKAAPPQPTN